MKRSIILFFLACLMTSCVQESSDYTDILVVGGGTSGVSAGISAARMGANTVIIEESEWLGGMLTAAGVSAVDGNYLLPSGFWGEFRDSLARHYGGLEALKTGWVSNVLFEPSVGNKILKTIAANEKNLRILFKSRLKSIVRERGRWVAEVETSTGVVTFQPKVVIDASELGDVALLCGVKYDIGMESRKLTAEDVAPLESNDIIQDITYVAILKDYGKDVTINQPEGYNPNDFACSCENSLCKTPTHNKTLWSKEKMLTYGKLPNGKYMINWPISGNDYFLNLIGKSNEERNEALKKAKNHTLCFLYFIQKELGFNNLGLADDEFPTEDLFPFIPYHRESLRIQGLVRFTLNHITEPYTQKEKLYRTAIAVGDYPVDHHHDKYPEWEKLPNLSFHPVPSFGLPLGVMIPKEVKGLLVAEKSISVSNIVNGATRLQPVVLQIGQAAGILGAISVKKGIELEKVSVREVQKALLESGGYLLPYLDVPKESPLFLPLQRIGVTGILQGVGKNSGWANQTWFRVDDKVLWSELGGLKDLYPYIKFSDKDTALSMSDLLELIKEIGEKESIPSSQDLTLLANEIYSKFSIPDFDFNRPLSRSESALLIDQLLNPFEKEVDMEGRYINLY